MQLIAAATCKSDHVGAAGTHIVVSGLVVSTEELVGAAHGLLLRRQRTVTLVLLGNRDGTHGWRGCDLGHCVVATQRLKESRRRKTVLMFHSLQLYLA